jgi:HD superfamily phosphohydrolase
MEREIRDPIHGFIQRTEQEEKIIDTRAFQRLRGIRQLAMANLVYPGALHTRFDHSIGVMHIADKLAKQLLKDEYDKEIKIIRLAALLHDLGHGPFSHVSEEVLKAYSNSSQITSSEMEEIHESITCAIIEKDEEIARIIQADDRKRIIELLRGKNQESLISSIISGPLDADKQDYLLRDSYFCGVKYGVFDIERLVGTLTVVDDPSRRSLAATDDGVYAIEQFVLAKYHMQRQVYRHRVRLITDSMIVRALRFGIDYDNIELLKILYTFDSTDEYIRNFLRWDDSSLINELLSKKYDGTFAGKIFQRLKERKLFKRIFSIKLIEMDPIVLSRLSDIGKEKEIELRKNIERGIAEFLSRNFKAKIDFREVIVNHFSFKSVRTTVMDERTIIIIGKNSKRSFIDESALFKSIDDKQSEEFLEVYAPIKTSESSKIEGFEDKIKNVLINETNKCINQNKKGEKDVPR